LSVGKIQALLVFFWVLRVGKNQMCLNVRLALYNDAHRISILSIVPAKVVHKNELPGIVVEIFKRSGEGMIDKI
jgi:hypothetical protein